MEELENELEILKTNLPDYVTALAWSADDAMLMASDASGNVALIQVGTQQVQIEKVCKDSILTMSASNEQNVVFLSSQDSTWKLLELPGLSLIAEGKTNAWIEQAHWSPDGQHLVFSYGKTLELRNRKGELMHTYSEHESTLTGLCWRYDSKAFATCCYGSLSIYEIHAQAKRKLPWKTSLISLEWSPDGKFIIAGTQDNAVHIWNAPFRENNDSEMSGYPAKVKCLSFDSKSKFLATNCLSDVVLWKFSGKPPHGQKPVELKGHASPIRQLKFQPNGKLLITGDALGFLLFWIPDLKRELYSGARLKGEISAIQWSNNTLYVAAATSEGEIVLMESPE
jgi:WD40 repeat protein